MCIERGNIKKVYFIGGRRRNQHAKFCCKAHWSIINDVFKLQNNEPEHVDIAHSGKHFVSLKEKTPICIYWNDIRCSSRISWWSWQSGFFQFWALLTAAGAQLKAPLRPTARLPLSGNESLRSPQPPVSLSQLGPSGISISGALCRDPPVPVWLHWAHWWASAFQLNASFLPSRASEEFPSLCWGGPPSFCSACGRLWPLLSEAYSSPAPLLPGVGLLGPSSPPR